MGLEMQMSNTELADELFVALDHAEILARNQMAGVIQYLSQGQHFTVAEIRLLVEEILADYRDPLTIPMRPFLLVN
jgi:hypothetical protein